MKEYDLESINNEIKLYLNEATFISDKVLKKVLVLISKCFFVDLPIDNYLKVDITIKENGNVIMKGDEYITNNKVKSINELYERYNQFKEKVSVILDKKEINFDKKRMKNDLVSFLITASLFILYILIILFCTFQVLSGNIYGGIWIVIIILPNISPKIKERYTGAIRFIKRLFKK